MIGKSRGKSVLSLVEMTIAMGVLAVCGMITVMLFLHAHFAGKVSTDINMAVLTAQSEAETLRQETPEEMNYSIGFDEDWQETPDDNPLFLMTIELEQLKGRGGILYSGTISVKRTRVYPFMQEDRKNLTDLDIEYYVQKDGGKQ